MNAASVTAIIDFEVYLLMTMKLRMSMANKEAQLEAKLAERGFSIDDGERIHQRVTEVLADEASRFENITKLLGIADQESRSLTYSSILWPGFDFNAIASEDRRLESARYWHTRRDSPSGAFPTELHTWSVDVTEFAEQFGPVTIRGKWPLFDKILPAYEEYEFSWNGERYGARFIWGLFLSSSIYWD
ncbi:hypothetical protein [Mycobacterium attenuatum]|uniref:hypothetical protein n=1 Tax=Mycobacterium attenuatum TaxID=2341086 RepID=UPI000F01C9AF|nr:hypothetical protein [Mycobacterium attenuatum]VBA59736.1 hypothetical protein LAUMK41_03646 [Mycobacterium attenuatum]VBA60635.1 hypothetical protein LAUMK191_05625 [Mycobacterium attenuatum]